MKNADKYPMNYKDNEGNILTEAAAQFILSLAPPVKTTWEDLEEIFLEDKIGREYYYCRQLQLNTSMKLSIASAQYRLYSAAYRPAMALFPSILPALDRIAMDGVTNEIDDHLRYLKKIVKGSFHPCNPSDYSKLKAVEASAKATDLEELSMALQLSDLIRDLDDKRFYIAPEGFEIKSILKPTFKPNPSAMLSEVAANGYFTDNVGMRFYVPDPNDKPQASYQLQLALESNLPSLKLILEHNVTPVYITKKEIIYVQKTKF